MLTELLTHLHVMWKTAQGEELAAWKGQLEILLHLCQREVSSPSKQGDAQLHPFTPATASPDN